MTVSATKSMLKNGRGDGLGKPEQGCAPAPILRGCIVCAEDMRPKSSSLAKLSTVFLRTL